MKQSLQELIKHISFFLHFAQSFVNDHQQRLQAHSEHQARAKKLRLACNNAQTRPELSPEILTQAHTLEEYLRKHYLGHTFYNHEELERILQTEKGDLHTIISQQKTLHDELVTAMQEIRTSDEAHAKKRIQQAFENMEEKEHDEESLGKSIDFLISLFERWSNILVDLKQSFDEELRILEQLQKSTLQEQLSLAEKIVAIATDIGFHLRREQEEFFIPADKYLHESKRIESHLQSSLKHKEKNLDDIKQDIRSLSSIEEVNEYSSSMIRFLNREIRTIRSQESNPENTKQEESYHHTIDFLSRFIEQKNRELRKSISEKARHQIEQHLDPLTQVTARGPFMALIPKFIQQVAEEENMLCAIVLFDIDHFKSFNDAYGHQVGDQVLKTVARIAKSKVKGKDIIARYGGEEFIIYAQAKSSLLTNKSRILHQLNHIAARIRDAVEHESTHIMREINKHHQIPAEKIRHNIEISGGIAVLETSGKSISEQEAMHVRDQLIKLADHALYQSKEHGRNRMSAAAILHI